jgi:hypothetical protein
MKMMSNLVLLAFVLLPACLSAFTITSPINVEYSSKRISFPHHLSQKSDTEKDTYSSAGFSQEVMDEANEALVAVGWAAPSDDAELTSDDPFVKSIDASIQREMGVGLEELLNPAKVSRC